MRIQSIGGRGIAQATLVTLGAARADMNPNPDPDHSRAEFALSHMVLSKIWGHIRIASLPIEAGAASVIPRRIDAILDVTHEDADHHTRDADLRSETDFDVARYPTMAFDSSNIVARGPDDAQVSDTITITITT